MSTLKTADAGEHASAGAATVAAPDARALHRAQWRMLFALMFVYLFYYTGRQNFGWALSSMQADLGLTMSQLGWISFAGLMTYGVGQFINGNLGDRFGGRTMMTLGGLLSTALNWLTSFGTSFWSTAAPWAANGYAQSMGWAPGSRMLSNWWPHAKGCCRSCGAPRCWRN
jgi:MFS transporter, OPA family, glycerol-3-phosphate transporter